MMAQSHSIQTTTNASSKRPLRHMPPPQTWDFLPHLHELLARVEAFDNPSTSSDALLSPDDQTPHEDESSDIGANYNRGSDFQPLNPKDLPTAALDIKKKIRDALKEVEKLPDIDRTVGEQTAELNALEDRIRRQKEMVRKIAMLAGEAERKLGAGASGT